MANTSDSDDMVPTPAAGAPPGDWASLTAPLPPLGILAGLSDASLVNLAGYGQYENVAVGTRIIREGDGQDRFYILVSGRLAIFASVGGNEIPLSQAEPGECLGEVALLEPGPASASVEALEETVLWSMNLDNLRLYLSEHSGGGGALLLGMAQCLSQRIRASNEKILRNYAVALGNTHNRDDRAITAENTPVNLSFFDRLKRTIAPEKKIQISTEIKM